MKFRDQTKLNCPMVGLGKMMPGSLISADLVMKKVTNLNDYLYVISTQFVLII